MPISLSEIKAWFEANFQPKGPDHIEITTEPTKLIYDDGETIDFSGLVVTAYNKYGTVWEKEGYTGGVIPTNELTFPVTVAEYTEE